MNWGTRDNQPQSGQTTQQHVEFSMTRSIKLGLNRLMCHSVGQETESDRSSSTCSGHLAQPTWEITTPNITQPATTKRADQSACQKPTVQLKCKGVLSGSPCSQLTVPAHHSNLSLGHAGSASQALQQPMRQAGSISQASQPS